MSGKEELTYLKELLGGNDYQPSDQKDLADYFARLQSLYSEYDYNNRLNPGLEQYFQRHRGANQGVIDLTSSSTNLPPYEPATRTSASVATAKEEEMYGHIKGLYAQAEEVKKNGKYLSDISHHLAHNTTPREMDEIPVSAITKGILTVLSYMKPKQIEAVKTAYEKTQAQHPVVHECIENCSDKDYAPRLPYDRREQRALKEAATTFILMASNEMLAGTYTKTEGLEAKFQRLKDEIEIERKRLPTGEQLAQQAAEVNEGTLKPAIIKMMEHLQGIKPEDVKPKNLTVVGTSSTHITKTALQTLVPEQSRNFFSRARNNQKKALLVFSTSWDGLKTFAPNANMDNSFIEGPVNAQALEDHIRTHILQGKFTDDIEAAKSEVRKRVGALIMNIPENPIGKIPSDNEMRDLAKVIEKYDIPIVIADEIFAAPGHKSLLTYPGMQERTYIISGISKNINTDIKLAYGYSANDDFAGKVEKGIAKDKLLHPIQSAAYGALLEETPPRFNHHLTMPIFG